MCGSSYSIFIPIWHNLMGSWYQQSPYKVQLDDVLIVCYFHNPNPSAMCSQAFRTKYYHTSVPGPIFLPVPLSSCPSWCHLCCCCHPVSSVACSLYLPCWSYLGPSSTHFCQWSWFLIFMLPYITTVHHSVFRTAVVASFPQWGFDATPLAPFYLQFSYLVYWGVLLSMSLATYVV